MIEACGTVSQAIAGIRSLEELESFVATIRRLGPPITKQPTEDEWRRIADMRIGFQRRMAK